MVIRPDRFIARTSHPTTNGWIPGSQITRGRLPPQRCFLCRVRRTRVLAEALGRSQVKELGRLSHHQVLLNVSGLRITGTGYSNSWKFRPELICNWGGPFATTRVPGRINLNTILHPEVLAALIDDPELFLPPDQFAGTPRFGLLGRPGNDGSRDWWSDLLWSRDGLHP